MVALQYKLLDWLISVCWQLQLLSASTKVPEKGGWPLLNPDLKVGAIQLYFNKLVLLNCPELQLGEMKFPPNFRASAHFLTKNVYKSFPDYKEVFDVSMMSKWI